VDPTGAAYHPDTRNYLSSAPVECRVHFTPGQWDIMLFALQNYLQHFQCLSAEFTVDVSLFDETLVHFNAHIENDFERTTIWWDVEGNGNWGYRNQRHVVHRYDYSAANSVTHSPSLKVVARYGAFREEVIVTKEDLINFQLYWSAPSIQIPYHLEVGMLNVVFFVHDSLTCFSTPDCR
jgi:hypothetical protein